MNIEPTHPVEQIHPDLRRTFKRMPALHIHSRAALIVVTALMRLFPAAKACSGVTIENRSLRRAGVRVYRPEQRLADAALLWIHGGGLILGRPEQDDRMCSVLARDLRLTVVSARYRVAPAHPFPGAIDDCFEVWQWLLGAASELGIDGARIAIGGQSAGGGLAAALTQRVLDADGVQPAAQLLFSPMLDDRTATRRELDGLRFPVWTYRTNRTAWSWYLGQPAGSPTAPPYAVPARRENLARLPPAWISVGSIDLFYDEDRDYAQRLKAAGVSCELRVVPQAPHMFESFAPDWAQTRELMLSAYRFLSETLHLS